VCTKEELVFADLICFNYAVYGKFFNGSFRWFPLLYVYYIEIMQDFSIRLKSRKRLQKAVEIFGYGQAQEFIEKFNAIAALQGSDSPRGYRYPRSFNTAPILGDYVKVSDLGKLN
jgi:hypothetical protein